MRCLLRWLARLCLSLPGMLRLAAARLGAGSFRVPTLPPLSHPSLSSSVLLLLHSQVLGAVRGGRCLRAHRFPSRLTCGCFEAGVSACLAEASRDALLAALRPSLRGGAERTPLHREIQLTLVNRSRHTFGETWSLEGSKSVATWEGAVRILPLRMTGRCDVRQ